MKYEIGFLIFCSFLKGIISYNLLILIISWYNSNSQKDIIHQKKKIKAIIRISLVTSSSYYDLPNNTYLGPFTIAYVLLLRMSYQAPHSLSCLKDIIIVSVLTALFLSENKHFFISHNNQTTVKFLNPLYPSAITVFLFPFIAKLLEKKKNTHTHCFQFLSISYLTPSNKSKFLYLASTITTAFDIVAYL